MRGSLKLFTSKWMPALLVLMLATLLLTTPLNQMRTTAQSRPDKDLQTEKSVGPETGMLAGSSQQVDTSKGGTMDTSNGGVSLREAEPNNNAATASRVYGNPIKVTADLFTAPFSAGTVDQDWYVITSSVAGAKLYAATMTNFSGGSTDTLLAVIASDGTTVLESDDEDGTVSGSASNIAGVTLGAPGDYYVRVTQFSITSLSGTIRPYDLYIKLLSGAPVAETEPNNNGTPQALAAGGWMSGVINPAADSDTFSFNATAGDTIVVIMDVDPERDAPEWNGRVGIATFNNFILVANGSAVGGTFDDANPSEAFFMTTKTTGVHTAYVDEPLAGGAPNDTYNLVVFVLSPVQRKCVSYLGGTTGPITDAGITNFTLNIPDSKIISSMQLTMSETHTGATPAVGDLDVSLVAPDGNEVVLFDDAPAAAGAGAPQFNVTLDDYAAIPIGIFGVHSGIHYKPELFGRLEFFKGQQAQGTWTLRVRDDAAANTGTLNSWSLNICEEPPLSACALTSTSILSTDFESSDSGFTHSGTGDEWERGLPSAASTPILTCHSGTNCWKTDLDATYSNSANYDLLSPPIDLTALSGRVITASWWQKYNIESASFDPLWIEVREVGNPTNFRKLWEWKGATMSRSVGTPATTVQASAGWGLQEHDISDFSGKNVELRFHVQTDPSGQFSGLAIDDVAVNSCVNPSRADFDGNGTTDLSVFRPSDGNWWIINGSNNSVTTQQFGQNGDKPVPADYDGDGDMGIAVYREGVLPNDPSVWYESLGSAQNFDATVFGITGDIPVPGDYDGDGEADIAVFREPLGEWHFLLSGTGFTSVAFGQNGDRPVQADYDGDGKTDIAVFRDGVWYIRQSYLGTVKAIQWGIEGDTPVTGDYDGDRQFDVAVFRDGAWYILLSATQTIRQVLWGLTGDIPVPADYDGDRKYDVAIWRPTGLETGNWYRINSRDGSFRGDHWGQAGDIPTPRSGNIPD